MCPHAKARYDMATSPEASLAIVTAYSAFSLSRSGRDAHFKIRAVTALSPSTIGGLVHNPALQSAGSALWAVWDVNDGTLLKDRCKMLSWAGAGCVAAAAEADMGGALVSM